MKLMYWVDPDSGEVDSIQLDVTTSESHEDTLAITDHPVERGANITDHARLDPERFSVEGIVSKVPNPAIDEDADYEVTDLNVDAMAPPGTQTVPLDIPVPGIQPSLTGLLNAGIGALTRALSPGPKATLRGNPKRAKLAQRARLFQQENKRNRPRDVYEKVLDAQKKAALVSVVTDLRDYHDMLIERVHPQRSKETGTGALFQIDLKRIKLSETETVAAPQPAEARGARARSTGSQAAKEDLNTEKKEPFRSSLKTFKDELTG